MRSYDNSVEVQVGQIWEISHFEDFLAEVVGFGFGSNRVAIILVPKGISCSVPTVQDLENIKAIPQCKFLQHKVGRFSCEYFTKLISTTGW